MDTEPLGLTISLLAAVPIALAIGVLLHFRIAAVIDDPVATESLSNITEQGHSTWVATSLRLGVSLIVSYLAAWLLPFRLTHHTGVDILIMIAVGIVAGITPTLYWLDWRLHRLPDRIVLPSLGAVTLLALAALVWALVDGSGTAVVVRALSMGAIAFGFFLALALLPLLVSGGRVSALGFGDVKLAPLCGFILGLAGWGTGVAGLILTTLLAAGYAVWLLAAKRGTIRDRIAYGPFMLIGTWTAMLFSTAFA